MKFEKIKMIGVCALLALAAGITPISQSYAATNNSQSCTTSITQENTGIGQFTNENGTTIENLCASAIAKANRAFDQTIDRNISNKLVITALNTMSKESKTNPEAKKLQEMYREARAEFTNGFLKENNLNSLPTVSDGKRTSDDFSNTLAQYTNQALTQERIQQLKQQFTNQAKASINFSMN